MAIPTPSDDNQQHLLQTVWDLFVTHSSWPTFTQVDRKFVRDFDLDMQVVGQRLPAELLYPPLGGWLAPDQDLRLTIAGAVACSAPRRTSGTSSKWFARRRNLRGAGRDVRWKRLTSRS